MAHFIQSHCFNNQREGGSFSKEVLHLKGQELVSTWNQRMRRKLLHPAYHQDICSLNYYLFWSMAHFLYSQHFINQGKVEASVKEFFTSKDKNLYQHGIKEWVKMWLLMVQYNYLYFECSPAFVVTWRIKEVSYQNIKNTFNFSSYYKENFQEESIWYVLQSSPSDVQNGYC